MCGNNEEICHNCIVPLLSVGADQASNIYYLCDARASVYAEHLDSIYGNQYIVQTRLFLDELKQKITSRVSIIIYISPNTITSSQRSVTLKSLISQNLVRVLCVGWRRWGLGEFSWPYR